MMISEPMIWLANECVLKIVYCFYANIMQEKPFFVSLIYFN